MAWLELPYVSYKGETMQYKDYVRVESIDAISHPRKVRDGGMWTVPLVASGHDITPYFESESDAVDFYNDAKSQCGIS